MEKPKRLSREVYIEAFCRAIAGGLTAYILSTIASHTPIASFTWAGFFSLLIYLATGKQKSWSMIATMFLSFLAGMGWGQLSNLIGYYVYPQNVQLTYIIDFGVLIFSLLFVHNSVLKNTKFGFVPAAFLGLVLTKAFFGRPIPFIGDGLIVDMPVWAGLLCLLGVFAFGAAFAMMIQYIGGFLMSKLLKPKDN